MKNIMFSMMAAFSLVAAFTSCNKNLGNETGLPGYEKVEDGKFDVSFKFTALSGEATKAAAEAQIDKINDVQIFVFDSTNNYLMETYYNGTSSSGKLRLSGGKKRVCAVVNGPQMGGIEKYSDFQDKISLFNQNRADNFVMSGMVKVTIGSDATIDILVKRLASKVVLKKIRTDFTSPVYCQATFKVDSIYLTNVATKCKYFDYQYTPEEWKKGFDITKELNLNHTVSNKSYEADHIFYAYPNASETNPTRLVVAATLGGKKYFYPVDLGCLESNKIYTITDLLITRPGSGSEDIPVVSEEFPYSIEVDNWNPDVTEVQEII